MITKDNIKEYAGCRFLVKQAEHLTQVSSVPEHQGMSGYSGISGCSGMKGELPIFGLKAVVLVNYKEVRICEVSDDKEYVRVANDSYNKYGQWCQTDNWLEAYEIIKILGPEPA